MTLDYGTQPKRTQPSWILFATSVVLVILSLFARLWYGVDEPFYLIYLDKVFTNSLFIFASCTGVACLMTAFVAAFQLLFKESETRQKLILVATLLLVAVSMWQSVAAINELVGDYLMFSGQFPMGWPTFSP